MVAKLAALRWYANLLFRRSVLILELRTLVPLIHRRRLLLRPLLLRHHI